MENYSLQNTPPSNEKQTENNNNNSNMISSAATLLIFLLLSLAASTITTTTTTTTTPNITTPPPATTATFAPLPSTVSDITTIAAAGSLQTLNQQTTIVGIASLILTAGSAALVKFYVPYAGLGSFVKTASCSDAAASIDVSAAGDSATITATAGGSAADVKLAMETCVAFNPSQATIDRGLAASKILGVEVTMGSGETGSAALQLDKIPFNTGPQTPYASAATSTCQQMVPRGARFGIDIGYVFYALLPMQITAATTDGFPLPVNIRVSANSSGFVNFRGTIMDDIPISIAFTASDTYQIATAYCKIVPVFISLRVRIGQLPPAAPVTVHVGTPFVFAVPLSMFISSSPYSITSVLQPGRLPLPDGVSFQSDLIVGRMPNVGLFNWTVTATDAVFNEAYGYVLIDSVNRPPRRLSTGALPAELGRAFAMRQLQLQVALNTLFVDDDNDPVSYAVDHQVPWLTALVKPGFRTTVPQTLILSGYVPRDARGTNISLSISCTDSYGAPVWLSGVIRVAMGQAPKQLKKLPQYNIEAEEALSAEIPVSDYFVSLDGDTLIGAYQLQPKVAWATVSITGIPPTLIITANHPEISEAHVDVLFTVSNALGDNVTATSRISVRPTDMQYFNKYAATVLAAVSAILSVLGFTVYFPHIRNTVMGNRLVTECPLYHKEQDGKGPVFMFPEETKVFSCMMRRKLNLPEAMGGHDVYEFLDYISHYLYNVVSLVPTPHSRPPVYLVSSEAKLRLVLPPPADGCLPMCVCRFFAPKNWLLLEFTVRLADVYQGLEGAPTPSAPAPATLAPAPDEQEDDLEMALLTGGDGGAAAASNAPANINNNNNNNNPLLLKEAEERFKSLESQMQYVIASLNEQQGQSNRQVASPLPSTDFKDL